MMKRKMILGLFIVLLIPVLLITGCTKTKNTAQPTPTISDTDASGEDTAVVPTKILVDMVVTGYGTINLELDPAAAPQSVYNFVNLAKTGFYEGLIFHRIVDGFVIQGGGFEPGMVRREWNNTIKGEFSENGFDNTIKHQKYVISWARTDLSMDSATTQFFICLNSASAQSLDGKYAAFGKVIGGFDVVDAIAAVEKNGEVPTTAVVIEKVTVITDCDLPEPSYIGES